MLLTQDSIEPSEKKQTGTGGKQNQQQSAPASF
jgi:hypothetical protein